MNTFIIIDSANLLHRWKNTVRGDIDQKIGLALHGLFTSINKVWKMFDGTHLVFAFEGNSWRKSYYKPYKANRLAKKQEMSVTELEEDALFNEMFKEFQTFITDNTNCTTLHHPELEGDDLIAGFIQAHPEDTHIIISSDSDFYQLVAPNVKHYNGVQEVLTTIEGIFDKDNKRVKDKKTNEILPPPDPEWLLFEKCIRGDTSDNVMSAFPGVRLKGSKKKVGLLEAYQDRNDKGYAWNNIMNSTWKDIKDVEHVVINDYTRNKMLIDLTAQPEDVRIKIFETIVEQIDNPKSHRLVGMTLIKFCNKYDLVKMLQQVEHFAIAFQKRYPANESD
jgi:5'-3' exonuclease